MWDFIPGLEGFLFIVIDLQDERFQSLLQPCETSSGSYQSILFEVWLYWTYFQENRESVCILDI